MKVEVYTTYSYCNCTEVELPEDKSFDDIKDVWMKYSDTTKTIIKDYDIFYY